MRFRPPAQGLLVGALLVAGVGVIWYRSLTPSAWLAKKQIQSVQVHVAPGWLGTSDGTPAWCEPDPKYVGCFLTGTALERVTDALRAPASSHYIESLPPEDRESPSRRMYSVQVKFHDGTWLNFWTYDFNTEDTFYGGAPRRFWQWFRYQNPEFAKEMAVLRSKVGHSQ